jgi:hypothetical protein
MTLVQTVDDRGHNQTIADCRVRQHIGRINLKHLPSIASFCVSSTIHSNDINGNQNGELRCESDQV